LSAAQADGFAGNVTKGAGATIVVSASGDVSALDLTDADSVIIENNVDVIMTRTQHDLLSVADGANIVTLADVGVTTGNALVESYVLADGIGNVFTTNAVGQTVTGGTGDDQITGAGGNDVIIGGDGADTITGGLGEDVLTGGNGADIFVFNSTDSASDIYSDTDFSGGLTDGDKFVGAFDIVRDFVTGVDQMDIDNSLTFFNTGYVGGEIYVDAGNVKAAMTDVPLGFALLIRGEFNEANNQFVVDFDNGVDTFVYYDVAGTNSGIVLENSILTSTADFI
jgi:Ca2+-binding RTX toxin-like protein